MYVGVETNLSAGYAVYAGKKFKGRELQKDILLFQLACNDRTGFLLYSCSIACYSFALPYSIHEQSIQKPAEPTAQHYVTHPDHVHYGIRGCKHPCYEKNAKHACWMTWD